MATFKITGPDGQTYRVTAPDDATEEQVMSYVQQNADKQSAMGGGPESEAPPKSAERMRGQSMPTGYKAANAVLKGATFNAGDELQGAVAAGGALLANALPDRFTPKVLEGLVGRSPSEAYRMMRDAARGAQDKFSADNPVTSTALEVGGGLTTGLGLARALPTAAGVFAPGSVPARMVSSFSTPASTVGRVGKAATVAGTQGAIGGAGSAETLADVPAEMGKGAAWGAATGTALNAAGQAVGSVTKNVISRGANTGIVQDQMERAAGGGGSAAGNWAAGKVSGWADDIAKQRLAVALTRDGVPPERVAAMLKQLGDDAPLVTGGEKNLSQLLDTVANQPGRSVELTEQAIRASQRGRGVRMTGDASNLVSVKPGEFAGSIEDWATKRAADAKPLYDKVRTITLEADDQLANLVNRAKSQGADKIAKAIAETRGAKFSLDNVSAATTGTLGVGKVPGSRLSMESLDYLKEGLDDLIKKQTDPAGKVSRQGLALVELRKQLLTKLDDSTTDGQGRSIYKAARDAYAGPSALIDAAEAGRRALRLDGTSIDKITSDMAESEVRAFQLGAFEALREKVGTQGGQTQLMKLWREQATQEKLRAIAPSIRTYQEFADAVMGESRRARQLEGAGRGSKTASAIARQDDEGGAVETAANVAGALKGNALGLWNAVKTLQNRTTMPEPVRDRIGQMLLMQGGEAQGLLGDLPGYIAQANARRAAAAGRTGLLSGVGVNSLLGD